MKSVIKTNDLKGEIKYPRLMITEWDDGDKMVVLFSQKNVGTVVYSTYTGWKLGDSNDSFNEAYFEPFNGTIELSNN